VFSFDGRCHGERESRKEIVVRNDSAISVCRAISVPWSQVIDRSKPAAGHSSWLAARRAGIAVT